MQNTVTIVNEAEGILCTLPRTVTWTLAGTTERSLIRFDDYTDGYYIQSVILK